MFFDLEKLDVNRVALDFGEEPESPVTVMATGTGVTRLLSGSGRANGGREIGIGYYTPMTYQVLARSWRPQSFVDLLGQEVVVQTLRNALESGTFGQAYLFSGLRGVGKTTAARLLAKAVNCAQGPTAEPCGACDSCREV
ncbi:MAG TPA: hypothetical protein VLT32_20080, partial [Candidatus Sulfomarinibacteraceae bacterium]|nr:hypothetical protein [Candidatus Sulfomarinibacteraceae bacterium]